MKNKDTKVHISQDEVVTREEFAFYLKSYRIGLGLSHEEMAEIIGTTVSSVKKYETGKQIPQDPYLVITAIRNHIKSKRK